VVTDHAHGLVTEKYENKKQPRRAPTTVGGRA